MGKSCCGEIGQGVDANLTITERQILSFLLKHYKETSKLPSDKEVQDALNILYSPEKRKKMVDQFLRRGITFGILHPDEENVLFHVLRKQYNVQEIHETTGFPKPQVRSILNTLTHLGMIKKEAEKFVPTNPCLIIPLTVDHKLILSDGREVGLGSAIDCLIDALGAPYMFNRNGTIVSKCLECGNEIQVVVDVKKGIVDQNFQNILVWLPQETQCGNINGFCSISHLKQWESKASIPPGVSITLEQAHQIGRALYKGRLDLDWGDRLVPPITEGLALENKLLGENNNTKAMRPKRRNTHFK